MFYFVFCIYFVFIYIYYYYKNYYFINIERETTIIYYRFKKVI